MANTLMSLLVKLGLDSTDFTKGMDAAKSKATGFGNTISGAVVSATPAILKTAQVVTAVGGAAVATGSAIYGMAIKGASAADDLLVLSAKTGVGVEKLQEMQYASELVDVSMETMSGSFTRMTMSMAAAKDGTGEQAALFEQLGVKVTDAAGNLRSTNSVWLDTIDALGGVQNQAERDAMSLKLFGRSAIELNPLIMAGKDALEKYGEEARNTGYVLSESQVNALGSVDDSIQKMKRGFEGILNQLASTFAPGISSVVSKVSGYIGNLGSILGDSTLSTSEKIGKAADLVKTIASDISKALPNLMETGLGIIKAILTGIIGAIPTLIPAVVSMLMSIVQFVVEMAPKLLEAAVVIVVTLANSITQSLPKLIPAIIDGVLLIVNTLLDNIPLIINAAILLIVALAKGLVMAIPKIIERLPEIIQALISGIIQLAPQLALAAVQLIVVLALGLIQALPTLLAAIPQIIMAIVNGLTSGVGAVRQSGGQLMAGFWEGISSWFDQIRNGITDFISSVVGTVQGALGIHSPSSVFANIGAQTIAGLAMGLSNVAPITDAVGNINGAMTASFSGSGAVMQQSAPTVGSNISFVINNPVGETTDESMGRGLKRLQWLGAV